MWRWLHAEVRSSNVICSLFFPVCQEKPFLFLKHVFKIRFAYLTFAFFQWSYYNDSPNKSFVPLKRRLHNIPVARGGSDGFSRTPKGQFKKGTKAGPGKSPVSSQCIPCTKCNNVFIFFRFQHEHLLFMMKTAPRFYHQHLHKVVFLFYIYYMCRCSLVVANK